MCKLFVNLNRKFEMRAARVFQCLKFLETLSKSIMDLLNACALRNLEEADSMEASLSVSVELFHV